MRWVNVLTLLDLFTGTGQSWRQTASEYDQKIPHLNTADEPRALRGRATEH